MCVALLTSVCFTGHFSQKKNILSADTVFSWNQPAVTTILMLSWSCCWHAAICYTVCAITSSTAPSMKCDWWHHQIHHPLVFLSWLRCGTRDGVQLVSGPFIWVHKWLILSTPEKRVLQQSAAATTLMECCLQHLFLELHSKTALQHSPKQRQRIDRASCQKEKRKWLPPAHAVVQVSGDP